jgi:phosphoribosyl-ATP pyrophosphohydrolase/phosphoribosyl-AMP cyclohydrolase
MKIDFEKMDGLVPVIIQHYKTLQVLMLGYMNEEAYRKTRQENKVTFYSRSKKRLWTKGESSGHYLMVKNIQVDCDADTILIMADPAGPTCHTGANSCFGNVTHSLSFLTELEGIIASRKNEKIATSYTQSLFAAGIDKIAQKVGEEATEVVIEAVSGRDENLLDESADLLFHLLVLLSAKEKTFENVLGVLETRHNTTKK